MRAGVVLSMHWESKSDATVAAVPVDCGSETGFDISAEDVVAVVSVRFDFIPNGPDEIHPTVLRVLCVYISRRGFMFAP